MLFWALQQKNAMVGMRVLRGAGVAALALVAANPVAFAGPKCARPDEVSAIQTAAVQQELMVAALTCNQIANFNEFQTGYGKELRLSDGRLQKMFQRLYGFRQGTSEYHAFKTRLANDSSIRSIHNNPDFCREAGQVFAAALVENRPSLAAFVSGVQVSEESPVNSCEISVAVGLSGAKTVPNVVPKPNPMRVANLAAPSGAAPSSATPANN